MWQERLSQLFKRRPDLRERVGSLILVDTPRLGVSGANVVFLTDRETKRFYAFKWVPSGQSNHSIAVQTRQRKFLAGLYGEHHLPEVLASTSDAMLMEYAGENLRSLIAAGRIPLDALERRVDRIYGKFADVWLERRLPYTSGSLKHHRLARDPQRRLKRIEQALRGITLHGLPLSAYWQSPLCINDGATCPSLAQVFKALRKGYVPPHFMVPCHGDPTGDNLLVDPAKEGPWQLIDWEWAGWHDWRVVVSFMGEWWWSNSTTVAQATIEIKKGQAVINYHLEAPPATRVITECAEALAGRIGKQFGEAEWRRQLALQRGLLLLGDLRFVEPRRLPVDHAVALLGRGIEILGSSLQ
ncbi:MAG: phosphotransferase [Candidatus Magasanikbacteria bacterium]|nr:phosphotransferase [Candidatus Magasanikbacteria bacterium]